MIEYHHLARPNELCYLKPFNAIATCGIDFHPPMHTFLIDDMPLKAMLNPFGTCITPTEFNGDPNDKELLKFLLPYLGKIADCRETIAEFTEKTSL